jgi:hypothetical protein
MKIDFAISAEDTAAYFYYMFWGRPEKKQNRRRSYIILAVGIISFLAMAFFTDSRPMRAGTIGGAVVMLLFLIFLPQYYRFIYSWLGRRAYRKNSMLQGDFHIELDEEKVMVTSAKTKTERLWSGIYKLVQTETLALLFVDEMNAHIIPKRYFKTDGQLVEFAGMCQRYAGSNEAMAKVNDHLVSE